MTNFFDIAIGRTLSRPSSPIKCVSFGNKGDYVILLHGLAHTSHSMCKIANALQAKGYTVINFEYPSRRYSIDVLANNFLDECIKTFCTNKNRKIHFVTHSLGGILVRKYLLNNPLIRIGRVVMITPPNHGSKFADLFKNNPLYRWIFGVAGQQLGANKRSYVNSLSQKIKFELGIIAGSKSINPLSYFIIKQQNDGIVSVSSTKIMGMKDHVTIPSPHYFILYNKETVKQVLYFLENSQFFKPNAQS